MISEACPGRSNRGVVPNGVVGGHWFSVMGGESIYGAIASNQPVHRVIGRPKEGLTLPVLVPRCFGSSAQGEESILREATFRCYSEQKNWRK